MKAIIAGTSLLKSSLVSGWTKQRLSTSYGKGYVFVGDGWVFLQRHGDPPVPPHRINHRANIDGLKALGVEGILSINSVGSLNKAISPGTLLIPHDFISPWFVPTFFDDEMRFIVPSLETDIRARLVAICMTIRLDVHDGGVYIQTIGPRLETMAEIALLRHFGDVVGMTMASEATLAMELGIPYASVCSVDNYCNGIATTPLTMAEIEANVHNNTTRLENLVEELIARGF